MRILLLSPSVAGGERSFIVFNLILARLRNRHSRQKADMQPRIALSLAQVEHPNSLRTYRWTRVELALLVNLRQAAAEAMPDKAVVPGGAGVGAGAPAVWVAGEGGGGGSVVGEGVGGAEAAPGGGGDAGGDFEKVGGEDALSMRWSL